MAWSVEGTYIEACNCEVACPCIFFSRPEINQQLIFRWQLNWKIARLLALENAGDINASTAIDIGLTCSITDQTPGIDRSTVKIARRDCV